MITLCRSLARLIATSHEALAGKEIPEESGLPVSDAIAAKFLDPLYYGFDEAYPHPFFNCNAAFSHGAIAHAQLQPLCGKVVPQFYGACSIHVPLPYPYDTSQSPPVRAHL
jgi:hypothetical protein